MATFAPKSCLVVGAVALLTLTACSSSGSGDGPGADVVTTTTAGSSTAPASTAGDASSTPTASASSSPDSGGSSMPSDIDDTYYPVARGNTWVYRTDYGAGSLGVVTDTETMTAVQPVAGGNQVTIKRVFHYASGQHPDFTSTVVYVFHSDGSLTVPYQSGIDTANSKITVRRGSIVWPTPARLRSGAVSTGTVEVTVQTASLTRNATVKVQLQGKGAAAVSVPAGAYPKAQILNETLTETLEGLPATIVITSQAYLVAGVGPVKTVVTSGAGTAPIQSVLVSFKKG